MIQQLLSQELRSLADRIDAGTCSISEDDALEIMSSMANVSMSQDEASRYLNMPPSTFRKKVDAGVLPKGHKRRGLTEKLWFLEDLKKVMRNRLHNNS